jgi:hypothetical protein
MNNGPLYLLVIFQHIYLPGVKVQFNEDGLLREDVLTSKYSFTKATFNNPLLLARAWNQPKLLTMKPTRRVVVAGEGRMGKMRTTRSSRRLVNHIRH